MRIGILGTGMLASALGSRWTRAGHEIAVAGRSLAKAQQVAARLGGRARALTVREAIVEVDAVLLAVPWSGVEDTLCRVEAFTGTLAGMTLIDPTNAVDHGVGVLHTPLGRSGAQRVAELAPGAHVVKAFHLFPAQQWSDPANPPVTVAICGDHPDALRVTETLVRDAGAHAAVLGPLDRARQLEEAAGFVIGLAFKGFDPRAAVPRVPATR
ncbi:NAD(P)-binding domain-containing protein [Nocardia iowensis]|uniref:NAD(P)-binding domain-containing protein n=2 Tax=Nocardia iowensis TaxID=204891 RepID=A0ABX8RMY1_NOCIO|nr:NAD(P)-binding domain-containing protein [Nocardia iowensis]QXN88756.1 NAD(P)-binding domain-containing protein [Nocardia iowensis]